MIIFRDDSTFIFIINNIYMERKNLRSNICTHMYIYIHYTWLVNTKLMLSQPGGSYIVCVTVYNIASPLLEKSTVHRWVELY